MSNGRAELAVKATKQLLIKNVGPNGELQNSRIVQALLTQRNTPDRDANYPLHRFFWDEIYRTHYLRKSIMTYNYLPISKMWRDVWNLKEKSL